MSVQQTSTDERQAEIELLEALIEEVDGRMDKADEQARNAAGAVRGAIDDYTHTYYEDI